MRGGSAAVDLWSWKVRGALAVIVACCVLCPLGAGAALAAPPQFGTEGEGAGQFRRPIGIAVNEETGNVYTADEENNRVDEFSKAGAFVRTWGFGVSDGREELEVCSAPGPCRAGNPGSAGGQLAQPQGLTVDNSAGLTHGDVYVEDPGNHRVERFGESGELILTFGGEVNAATHGDVCAAMETCQAGTSGPGPSQFESLGRNGVTVGPTGIVYVGDIERVQRFMPSGAAEGEIPLPAGVGAVELLAVSTGGELYVLSSGLPGIRKYTGGGVEQPRPRDPEAQGFQPAITLGAGEELLVSDPPKGRVLEYDAAGVQRGSFPEGEDASGGIALNDLLRALYTLFQNPARVLVPTVPPPGPVVLEESEQASEVLPTSAKLNATINPEGGAETTEHFEYVDQAHFEAEGGFASAHTLSTAQSAPLETVNEVQLLSVTASGGGFTLSFQGESSGEVPFNATAGEVQAALEALPDVGSGAVAVSGAEGGPWRIEFTGALSGSNVAELQVEGAGLTGPEPSATVSTEVQGISLFDDRQVAAAISGLSPSTLYHFRVVATNALHQTTTGPDETFRALPPVSIDSESATTVTTTSAKLLAELNPHGLPSEYHFEYGLTSAYEKSAPIPDAEAGEGSQDEVFGVAIEELRPHTTYHYRVVADNSLGVVEGPDQSFTTEETEAPASIDGRGDEMVSPPDKHGVSLEGLSNSGGVIEAANDGDGLAYFSLGPIDQGPAGNRSSKPSQLLARREGAGVWSSEDLATPHRAPAGVEVGDPSEYKLFSSELEEGAVEPAGATPLSPLASERTPYLRQAGGSYTPLVYAGNVPAGTKFGPTENSPEHFGADGVEFVMGTEDLGHVLLRSPSSLVQGFETAGNASDYEWSEGKLTAVSILPGGGPSSEEGGAQVGNNDSQMRGAISAQGSRVFFTTTAQGRLYVREMPHGGAPGETLRVDAAEAGLAAAEGAATFQLANSDGSKVFFTDNQRLTKDATAVLAQPDLYECEIVLEGGKLACKLTDLSVDTHPGEAANVQGTVIGAGEDGRYVYFVAEGALSDGAAQGSCPQASEGQCVNLYVYDTVAHSRRLVAVLSAADFPDWQPSLHPSFDLGQLTSRVSPDGRYLTFMSERPLTGYDNRDARSGARDEEVFLYDREADELRCASCDPTGARPVGVLDESNPGPLIDRPHSWEGHWLAASIPGWTRVDEGHALHQPRYLSNSGRLFFNSAQALVPADGNGTQDVYELEPDGVGGCGEGSGCVSLISSGSSSEETAFLDASESGDDVFFLTAAQLSKADQDNAFDVYDAHVCSLAPGCANEAGGSPPPCISSDACRAAPAAQPDIFGAPASSTFSGTGNLAPPAAVKAKVTPPTRTQLLAKALKTCRKDKKARKRKACEKRAQKRYGAKKAGRKAKKARDPRSAGQPTNNRRSK
jgi:hypothetical protein